MQMHRSEEEVVALEKKIKAAWKAKDDPARGAVIIAQAKMKIEYTIGKCNSGNHQLWNYHYFEELKKQS